MHTVLLFAVLKPITYETTETVYVKDRKAVEGLYQPR